MGEARYDRSGQWTAVRRIGESIKHGKRTEQATAMVRLFKGDAARRIITLAFEASGAEGAAWSEGSMAARSTINFLMRQVGSIGGGTPR